MFSGAAPRSRKGGNGNDFELEAVDFLEGMMQLADMFSGRHRLVHVTSQDNTHATFSGCL